MLSFIFARQRWNFVVGFMILLVAGALTFVAVGVVSGNSALAGLGSVLAAVAAISATILVQIRRDEVEQSKFFLEKALEGFRTSLQFFEGNNDRVRWIAGARILEHSRRLAASISEPAHMNVYEMHREDMRDRIARVLGYDNPSRTANFFLGISADAGPEEMRRDRQVRRLDHSSLCALLEFSEFPRGYVDPLAEHRLTESDLQRTRRNFPALHHYLADYFNEMRRRAEIRARHPDHPPSL